MSAEAAVPVPMPVPVPVPVAEEAEAEAGVSGLVVARRPLSHARLRTERCHPVRHPSLGSSSSSRSRHLLDAPKGVLFPIRLHQCWHGYCY